MKHNPKLKKLLKFLASIRLAIFVMLAISVLIAIGTVVESKYDAEAANKLVYNTLWMKLFLGLLIVVLLAVMVDRWPWRKKHAPFLLAHIGIIILLMGALVTQKYGLDGILRIELFGSSRILTTPITDIVVYQSRDGYQFEESFKKEVDFFLEAPTEKNPLIIPAGGFDIKIIEFQNYVLPTKKIISSTDPLAGSGLRYQVHSDEVQQSEWIFQSNPQEFVRQSAGPAEIVLSSNFIDFNRQNVVLLVPEGPYLKYFIFHKDRVKPFAEGKITEGESIKLGWMNLKLKILRYFPLADKTWDIVIKDRPSPLTKAAIRIQYQDQEKWLLLNDVVRMVRSGALIRLVYSQRRIPLDFTLSLKQFEIEYYPGSKKILGYKSLVSVPDGSEYTISMNEPLKYNGLTIYQASFETDDRAAPVASIFSVNRDPGRWIKYVGAFIMAIGIILLFYFKKYYT